MLTVARPRVDRSLRAAGAKLYGGVNWRSIDGCL